MELNLLPFTYMEVSTNLNGNFHGSRSKEKSVDPYGIHVEAAGSL